MQRVTGARDPAVDPPLTATNYPAPGQWSALRYLAQVSVNIVDFLDSDDFSTPFPWGGATSPNEWVYGVEMPRLVLNEIYAQLDNDPTDPGIFAPGGGLQQSPAATRYYSNLWVELLNPFNAGLEQPPFYSGPGSDLTARLVVTPANPAIPAYPAYQVVVAASTITAALQDPANVLGDPAFAPLPPGAVLSIVDATGANTGLPIPPASVAPVGTSYAPVLGNGAPVTDGSQGFYVLGALPKYGLAAQSPNLLTTGQSPGLSVLVSDPTTATPPQYTVLLRRLLCPALPPNQNQADPLYNPYITVDYVANTVKNDARQFNNAGPNNLTPIASRVSQGRRQPWSANTLMNQNPILPTLPVPPQPLHTFFRHNGQHPTPTPGDPTLALPFPWLGHLDRQLVSKGELLLVSACKPHELTQWFLQGTTPYSHLVPWTDPRALLSRFLELVDVPPRMAGLVNGDRVAGRINTNMVMTGDPLAAVADREPANAYQDSDVTAFANDFLQTRTQYYNQSPLSVTVFDQPSWGLGTGGLNGPSALTMQQDPRASGLLNFWHAPPNNWSTFPPTPYEKTELLNKLFNNATSRSNVFAVWVTVGFFEVTNNPSSGFLGTGTDFSAPPQLGAEIGRSEGRQIRHRMFAIVDRTGLVAMTGPGMNAITIPPGQNSVQSAIGMTQAVDARTGRTWTLQPNMTLIYEPNTPNQEMVIAQQNGPGTPIFGTFFKSHPAGCQVVSRGNPGPWLRYDPRQDTEVVRYLAIIE